MNSKVVSIHIFTIKFLILASMLAMHNFLQGQENQQELSRKTDTLKQKLFDEPDSVFYQRLNQKGNDSKFLRELLNITLKDQETQSQPELADNTEKWIPFRGLIISNIIIKQPPPGSALLPNVIENDSSKINQLINRLHIYTKPAVIQKNLFIKTGDSLIPWKLADNEKLIRNLPYIENARFYVESVSKDSLTLILVVQDKIPYGVFPTIHSANKQSLKIWNSNFMGYGNEFGFRIANDKPEFYMSEIYFTLSNLNKKFIQNSMIYQRSLENEYYTLSLRRLYQPGAYKLAGGLELARKQETLPSWFSTDILAQSEMRYLQGNVWLGYQYEIKAQTEKKRPEYLIPAIGIYNTYFQKRPFTSADSNYMLNNCTRLIASVNWLNQNFAESDKLFAQDHPQALPVGFRAGLTLGYRWGEFSKMPYAGIDFRWSKLGKPADFWVFTAGFGSYIHRQKLYQGVVKGSLYYLSTLMPVGDYSFRLLNGINYTRGINRLSYDSLYLNNEHGIIGLKTDVIRGMKRINSEFQFILYTPWKWLGFSFTPYLIAESGFIAEENEQLFNKRLVSALGIGLRLRNKYLVFSSIQLRLMYYPYAPGGASSWSFDLTDNIGWEIFDFEPQQPSELIFE
jgi:hypothetical protein